MLYLFIFYRASASAITRSAFCTTARAGSRASSPGHAGRFYCLTSRDAEAGSEQADAPPALARRRCGALFLRFDAACGAYFRGDTYDADITAARADFTPHDDKARCLFERKYGSRQQSTRRRPRVERAGFTLLLASSPSLMEPVDMLPLHVLADYRSRWAELRFREKIPRRSRFRRVGEPSGFTRHMKLRHTLACTAFLGRFIPPSQRDAFRRFQMPSRRR